MDFKFQELTTESEVRELIKEYNNKYEYVALDCETTGLSYFSDRLSAITISGNDSKQAYFIDASCAHLFKALNKPLVLHNFKFDFRFLLLNGVDLRIPGLLGDTLHLDHLLNENQPHGLDDIIQRRYQDNYKQVFWDTYKEYTDAPKEVQIEYACKDVLYTDLIYRDTISDLSSSGIPKSLIEHVKKLALSLYDTEVRGIKLDIPYLSSKGEELSHKITTLKDSMKKSVDFECQLIENEMYEVELEKRSTPKGKLGVKRPSFNFDSHNQLGKLIYDKLRLPIQLNKQRNRTCDDAALETLEPKHEVIKLLREYRSHQKVFTAFIEGSLEKAHEGRVYPSFNVCGTVTGRISSSEPNLQQLPSQGGVRGIYVPEEGKGFISADYKQLEVVIAAHFSRDPALLSVVHEGASLHDITAAGLGIPRTTAKTVNFALQFGAGPPKLKSILGCSDQDAERAYNKYWETYRGLREFNRRCHDQIDKGEPIESPWGRRRNFPKVFDTKWEKERAKRQAPNSLIQGTGSDCTSWSLYTIKERLKAIGVEGVLFSVHDEIIAEVEISKSEQCREIIKNTMVEVGTIINLSVPLSAEVSPIMSRWED